MQNRNQINTANGPLYLTVPVNADRSTTIREVTIAEPGWQKKHIRSVEHFYAHTPYFKLFEEGLRPILEEPWTNLCDLNIAVTTWIFAQLGITCKTVRASELEVGGAKEELILGICEAMGATVYLSGTGAAAYQSEKDFESRGMELRYQSYKNPPYEQANSKTFVPDLSALDLILNQGPKAREVMLSGRTVTAADAVLS